MKNTFTDPLFVNIWFTKHHIKALIMRVSQVSILIMTSAILTMAAPKGNGQSIENTTVDVGFKNESLKEVFREIERQTDFLFSWDEALEKAFPEVSLEEGRYTVREVLDIVLEGTGMEFRHSGNYVIFLPMKENGSLTEREIGRIETHLETLVTGTVTDASTQEPLAAVNILVKGKTVGTNTDSDGKFAIEAMVDDILVFSFIGYKTAEVLVNKQIVVNVVMEQETVKLEEVVISTGYWQTDRKQSTSNIAKITRKEIEEQPVLNPLQALQGRVPGVNITQNTGVPGGSFNIQIRGQNSLRNTPDNNGNYPLYVIDGVPFPAVSLTDNTLNQITQRGNPLSTINPNDIESIEILKDADATAIYGSRGANGVVLITTKKGKLGKTAVDINFQRGFGDVYTKLDLLNTPQYLEMIKEALINDGFDLNNLPLGIQGFLPDLYKWDQNRYTDWQEELIGGTSEVTNAQASISGGNDYTQFLFSGAYYNETTVFPGDFGLKRISGLLSLNHRSIDQRFQFSVSLNFSSQISNLMPHGLPEKAVTLAPNAPALFKEDGTLNWENSTWINPLASLEQRYDSKTTNLITNANVSYELIQGVLLKANFGYNNMQVKETRILPLAGIDPAFRASTTGSSNFANGRLETWIIEPQTEYRHRIGQGELIVLAGATFQESMQEKQSVAGVGYTSDALLLNLKAAPIVASGNAFYSQYRYSAFFGRINYNWKEKYILNLTARRDGSSRFGPGNQFGNFGAVGIGWIFTGENFLKDNQFINFGKLRASYGTTGSDAIGDYGFLDTYSANLPYAGTSGLIVTRLSNKNFSWETVKKFEMGMELGLLKDRMFFTASRYHNRASDQLVGFPLPVITGQTSVQFNLPGIVENKGWEFTFNSTNIQTGNFKWTSNVNLTIPRNKLLKYEGLAGSPFANRYRVGKSLFVQPSLHVTGVDPDNGVYTFIDVNGDGEIRWPDDIAALPEITQDFFGGIQNTFGFKGLSLSFLLDIRKQTGFGFPSGYSKPGTLINQPSIVLDRWQQSGDITDIQRFSLIDPNASNAWSNVFNGDNRVVDASFMRLRNVSLSYIFSSQLLKKVKIQSLKVYALGQNLFTITSYMGFDPETQRIDVLPPLRVITVGVQVSL